MSYEFILKNLPYKQPFLFVDEISFANENSIEGSYIFREDEFFYTGHFADQPITPGVILTECMAQIGLTAFGIYLLHLQNIDVSFSTDKLPLFTSANIQFYKKVLPGQKVFVTGKKIVFRHGKLRSSVCMKDDANNLICDGELSGMFQ